MKYFLYFLILFIFITCNKERRPKIDREEMENKVIQCVEESPEASEQIKEIIKENKDKGFRKILRELKHKVPKEDRKLVRNCRKKVFGEIRKAHKGDL